MYLVGLRTYCVCYITRRFSYFQWPFANTVSEGWIRMSTMLQRSLPLCEQRQLHSVHRSTASSAASDWSHFPITRLSLAASLLIIEVGKGVPSLRDGERLSLPPVCNISSAVYHTERYDIGSEYVETTSWFFLDSLVRRVRNEKMQKKKKCSSLCRSVRRQRENLPLYEFSCKLILRTLAKLCRTINQTPVTIVG